MTKENKQNLADTDKGTYSLYPCRLNSVYFPLSLQFITVFYLEEFFFCCVHQMDLRYAFDLQTFLYVYMTLLTELLISSIIIITIPVLYSISIAANIIIIATDSLLIFHRISGLNYSEAHLLKSYFSMGNLLLDQAESELGVTKWGN